MEASPLAKLPAELGNNIYELALTYDAPFKIRFTKKGSFYRNVGVHSTCSLLLCRKQIGTEAAPLPYMNNTFSFPKRTHLLHFLDEIKEVNRCSVTSISFFTYRFDTAWWYEDGHRWLAGVMLVADEKLGFSTDCSLTAVFKIRFIERDSVGDSTIKFDLRDIALSCSTTKTRLQISRAKATQQRHRDCLDDLLSSLEKYRSAFARRDGDGTAVST